MDSAILDNAQCTMHLTKKACSFSALQINICSLGLTAIALPLDCARAQR